MKVATQPLYGPPEILQFSERDRPSAGTGEIVVRVHASIVSHGDRRLRAGDFPGISWLPGRLAIGVRGPRKDVPGTMLAGRVVAVGEGVTRFEVGDDVFGSVDAGAHGEYVLVDQGGPIATMPPGLSYTDAAAVPYGAVTALAFLRDLAALKRGERALIIGGGGGVGVQAVQLARHLGAEVTVVDGAGKAEWLRALGADHVIDRRREDFRANGQRYDVIFDTLGVSSFRACRRSLTPSGRYLSLHVTGLLLLQMLMTRVAGGRRALTGVSMGTAAQMEDVRVLVEQGALRPVVDRVLPFSQLVDAHRAVEGGGLRGTVVVTVAPPVTIAPRATA